VLRPAAPSLDKAFAAITQDVADEECFIQQCRMLDLGSVTGTMRAPRDCKAGRMPALPGAVRASSACTPCLLPGSERYE
jgi:hypothetical protein